METDSFLTRLRAIDEASKALRQEFTDLERAIVEVRSAREGGQRVSEIIEIGSVAPARKRVRASWGRLNDALHAYRVQGVRAMVDDEGMSIADAARVTGNARQVVSRLYHEG